MNSHSGERYAPAEQLYFAFGSNLHLSQMATRCPESRFVGFAILPSHRFQINERGFANVVPSQRYHVEGLCYLLSLEDQRRLDRSEGVPTAYQRLSLPVQVLVAPIHLVGRKVSELSGSLQGVQPFTSWNTRNSRVDASLSISDILQDSGLMTIFIGCESTASRRKLGRESS